MAALEGSSLRHEEAFQRLLLQISSAAAEEVDTSFLIRLFCRLTREFFQVDLACFWRFESPDELVGTEADGPLTDRFVGLRLKGSDSAVAIDAIHQRKTLYVNHLPERFALAAQFQARSLMAAPLVVANEIIGAAAFVNSADPDFFNDDLAAKATILAGQLGSLLEANRLTEAARTEQRRAEILAEVAQSLNTSSDNVCVMERVADRLRILLRAPLVCVLIGQESGFNLHAVAAESHELTESVRPRYDRKGMQFAADLATRAATAGETISVTIGPSSHTLGDLVPAGILIATPFRASRNQGAVLIYPRSDAAFNAEEKALVAAVVNFGAVALANAELYSTAKAQSRELHQLLDIVSELSSIGQLNQFMQEFSLRSADFLGFGRAFVGLLEDGRFHIRWKAEHGQSGQIELPLSPDGMVSKALNNKEVFWSDDLTKLPGANLSRLATFKIHQLLAVPLLGTDGKVLGMFGVLDRLDGEGISQENIRLAKVLASQAAVALEVTRNLDLANQHRTRAEALMGLALELNSVLQLPEFARRFATRASVMMQASAVALAVKQESTLETLAVQYLSGPELDKPSLQRFNIGLQDALTHNSQPIVSLAAADIFGADLTAILAWKDCTLVRLLSPSGEVLGALCLANRGKALSKEDEQLLQAISGQASVALDNARLFTRMDRANRHWMEIFDAISDFIVVHDETNNILRVNRSLADFIGVPPSALVGVNMCALLSTETAVTVRSCPFCRTDNSATDEYVHPVLDQTYLVSTSRVHSASSEGLQTIHVLKDITDRREAERRYRELFDNIQEGLFFSTPDGRFIEVNDALVRMLGYDSREELLQTDIGAQIYTSREQYQGFAEQMREKGVVRNYEEMLRRKDGSAVYVMINAFAVRDSHDRIIQYRGLMLDVSGSKSFQVELQRERDFSGKILNNTQSLILVVDTAGLISYANRRWADMGYEQRQLMGCPLKDLVAPSRRDAFQEAFQSTVDGHQADNIDLQIFYADGRGGQFSVNLSPMRDEQGGVTSVVVVMTDVTDSVTLQAKLMHAEKMAAVGQLVSGVAHEVNNPLTAILGFADLLMENETLPDSVRRDLRVILQESQRTKQIVQNLLSFARQMPPQRMPVHLNDILHRTVQLRVYDFNSHGVEVSEQFDESLPDVVGDSQQLQQVFLNILNNAYDAVRDSGRASRIDIMTTRRGDFVEIWFRDNGHGITHADRIFDPFFTTKEVGKGTGLGLSICYGIVREHGGEILSHNNADGPGATFIVRLPADSESASVGAAAGVIQR